MIGPWIGLGVGLVWLAAPAADDPPPKAPDVGATYRVPYRKTDTNHALVRVRINGKGPFNFLVDTGAPLLFVSTDTAAKVGLKVPKDSFYTQVDRVDFEGGPFLTGLKARVEDPFQLVGMNAMGLPGATIDGILGFSVLARFRFALDPTDDRMTWTRLDHEPEDLEVPDDPKERAAPEDVQAMNMMGPLMKFAAMLLGKKPETKLQPRGWLGLTFAAADTNGPPRVAQALADSPASQAGLKPGDRVTRINAKAIADVKAAREALAQVAPGDEVKLTIDRDGSEREITLVAGEGL